MATHHILSWSIWFPTCPPFSFLLTFWVHDSYPYTTSGLLYPHAYIIFSHTNTYFSFHFLLTAAKTLVHSSTIWLSSATRVLSSAMSTSRYIHLCTSSGPPIQAIMFRHSAAFIILHLFTFTFSFFLSDTLKVCQELSSFSVESATRAFIYRCQWIHLPCLHHPKNTIDFSLSLKTLVFIPITIISINKLNHGDTTHPWRPTLTRNLLTHMLYSPEENSLHLVT